MKHGHARKGKVSRTFNTWDKMFERCYNIKHDAFPRYGGRGIQVCCRWHRSNPDAFKNFLADMGERPEGLNLDRINNDYSYMPSNCRWVTAHEQALNRRPKTHCRRGHIFTEKDREKDLKDARGYRQKCRICRRARERKY